MDAWNLRLMPCQLQCPGRRWCPQSCPLPAAHPLDRCSLVSIVPWSLQSSLHPSRCWPLPPIHTIHAIHAMPSVPTAAHARPSLLPLLLRCCLMRLRPTSRSRAPWGGVGGDRTEEGGGATLGALVSQPGSHPLDDPIRESRGGPVIRLGQSCNQPVLPSFARGDLEAEVSVHWHGARAGGGSAGGHASWAVLRTTTGMGGHVPPAKQRGGRVAGHPDLGPVSSLSPEVWAWLAQGKARAAARRPSTLAPRFANPHGESHDDPDEGEGGKVENLAASSQRASAAAAKCPQSQSAMRGGVPRPPPLAPCWLLLPSTAQSCPGRY